MKKQILIILLFSLMLVGCSSTNTKNNDQKNTTSEVSSEKETDSEVSDNDQTQEFQAYLSQYDLAQLSKIPYDNYVELKNDTEESTDESVINKDSWKKLIGVFYSEKDNQWIAYYE